MLTQHLALVPEDDGVSASDLARVSAALQKQVTRDLAPIWDVAATVDAFPRLEDVPIGYWPVIVTRCPLGRDAGVHLDRSGQPYAQVEVSTSWSFEASRACLEMLVNPFGNRTLAIASPRSDQGAVDLLLEVTAPCEDMLHAYAVNDVIVSDFCTPGFFHARAASAVERYSFNGSIDKPFRLLQGGHLTWWDPVTESWWLRSHFGENPVDTKLGIADRKVVSVRELVRARAPLRSQPDVLALNALEARVEANRQHAEQASARRAHQLRALLGDRLDAQLDAAFDALQSPREIRDWPPPIARPLPVSLAPSREREQRAQVVELRQHEDEEVEITVEVTQADEPAPRAPQSAIAAKPAAVARAAVEAEPAPQAPASRSIAPPPLPPAPPMPSSIPSLRPVSIPSAQPSTRGRDGLLLVGGALAAAAVIGLSWSGRSSMAPARGSAPVARSAASAIAPAGPPAAPATRTAPPIEAMAPDVVTPLAASPAEPAVAARPTADAAPKPPAVLPPSPSTSVQKHHPRRESPPSPPVVETRVETRVQPAAAPRASDAIDALIDTRR